MGIKNIIFTVAICMMSWTQLEAQPTSGDPNGGGKPGTAPISGIEILIGLGGLLGAKKIFDAKRKKN